MLLGKGGKFTNPRVRFVMTDTGRSLIAEMSPELGFIAGKIGDFSECGHNFRPGETVEKSLLLLNDTRRDLKVPYRWSVPALKVGGSGTVEIEPGCRVDIPIRFRIPSETAATALQIQAEFDFLVGRGPFQSGIDFPNRRQIVIPLNGRTDIQSVQLQTDGRLRG